MTLELNKDHKCGLGWAGDDMAFSSSNQVICSTPLSLLFCPLDPHIVNGIGTNCYSQTICSALNMTGWDGMGWDGMGWDGMGWDGMGWDGMGWDGMGFNPIFVHSIQHSFSDLKLFLPAICCYICSCYLTAVIENRGRFTRIITQSQCLSVVVNDPTLSYHITTYRTFYAASTVNVT